MKKLIVAALLAAAAVYAQNAVVRQSRVSFFAAQAATATATSSAVLVPNYSGYGTLSVVGVGITGSPSGCQVALAFVQSTGGSASSAFAAETFTPAVSYQGFQIAPSSAAYTTGDSMIATFSCSVYPTGGTLSVAFDATAPVNVLGTVPVSGSFWQTTQPVSGSFWQATQPVSGTITTTPPANASTNLAQVGGSAVSLGQQLAAASIPVILPAATITALTPPTTVAVTGSFWQTTQPVSGTFWQATQPVSGTVTTSPPSNASTNLAQFGGSAVTLGQQLAAASIPVILPAATITALTPPTTVAVTGTFWQTTQPVSGTFWQTTQPVSGTVTTSPPANASTNLAQVNGVTVLTGAGATGTGAQRHTVAQDTTTIAGSAPGTAGTASANVITVQGVASMTPLKADLLGNAGATLDGAPGSAAATNALQVAGTDGTNGRVHFLDPCEFNAWTYYPVNISSNTQVIAGSSGKNVYLCGGLFPPQAGAVNVNIVESATSGNACATSPTGMLGGATAALGANIVANGGYVIPSMGQHAAAKTATSGDALCIFTSASVNGVIAYVQF